MAGVFIVTVTLAHAQTFWTGPTNTFINPGNNATDILTANVILTRAIGSGGLFNIANQPNWFTGATPPAGTTWTVATLSHYMSFPTNTFGPCPLEAGMRPPNDIGTTYVVHLVTNNIYLQLTLTSWGGGVLGGAPGSYSYMRTTPAAVAPPPTISITSPANGAVFAAPASEKITANATVSSGTVTNVQFFTNNVLVGSVITTPFALTPTLAAGNYALTAAATAAGISTTSSVVNISVVTPIAVTLTNGHTTAGPGFQFSYSANVGLSYEIDRATTLAPPNWVPVATNVAASNPTNYLDTHATSNPAFYRVGRLPNP